MHIHCGLIGPETLAHRFGSFFRDKELIVLSLKIFYLVLPTIFYGTRAPIGSVRSPS